MVKSSLSVLGSDEIDEGAHNLLRFQRDWGLIGSRHPQFV